TRIRRSTAPGLSLPVPAGTLLPVEVTLYDAYGNIATGNDEVMRISTSDEAAIVSNPVVFTAGDPAQHDFSLQFHTAYTPGWDLNASMDDADFGCSAPGVYPVSHGPFTAIETEFIQNCDLRPQGRAPFVNPQPGCPPLSGDVWAGQNVLLFAAEVDPYNNTIDDSTDTLCVTAPNDATFQQQTAGLTGNSGQTFINTSFGAVGLQTATVSVCEGVMQGTAGPLNVHGFVYTDPPNADSAPISLIQSSGATASAMMLDLAVPDGAELNRVFSAGVDIPINGGIGGVQIAKAALDVGTGTQAIAAAIGGPQGNLLLAGASHKRAGAGAQPNDASFSDLDSAFTLTLQLGEASYPFVVFDGANLGPGFRAGVRDHLGNEVVHSWQVGIGKLEIR
ncbi:MAG TPA: hypothetical protein VLW85_16415, partial [Myxococcales bacterium]|nr:hypothetical protein [Myxococcales bacterium]